MPYVRVTSDVDWSPVPAQTIAYKAGWEGLVTNPCATALVADGKAVRVTKRKAKDEAGDEEEAQEDGDEQ